ncbi:unnamed protein product [Clonostachys chloroleuca]|uniref:Protein kinase domain-containing protein n=1 Tax=Clonostachys chloroleuca TaxID=1926264 RepID=A0AA35LWA7_9HYPO|nr:unnamed protein product [Clonostachys chloroleuca]
MEDLVTGLALHWKLQCTIEEGCTAHTKYVSGHATGVRRMPIQERWERDGERLGQGTFGVVWREVCTSGPSTGKSRAVKQIFKNFGSRSISSKALSAELSAIMRFSDEAYRDYFVRSYGWYDTKDFLYITMEYLPSTWGFVAVLEGLRFMHQNNVAHRDLKPNNLLVQHAGPSWWVKISDFGTSKEMDIATLCSNVGTVVYQAPEVRGIVKLDDAAGGNQQLSPSVDIWAVGAIAFRLTSGRVPFEDLLGLCRYVDQGDPLPFEDGISGGSITFVTRLLAPMPYDRPTASEALADPWLSVSASEVDLTRTDHPMTVLVRDPNSATDLTEDASAEWPPTEPCNEPPPSLTKFPIDVSHDADFAQPIQQYWPTSPSSDSQRVSSAETGDNVPRLTYSRKSDALEHKIVPRHRSKPLASPIKRESPPKAEYPGSGRRSSWVSQLPSCKAVKRLSSESQGCRLQAVDYSDDGRTLFLITNHYIHTYHSVGEGQWDQGIVIDIRRTSLNWKIWEGIKPIDIPDNGIHSFVIAGRNPVLFVRDIEGTNFVNTYTSDHLGVSYWSSTFTIPLEEEITASAISENGKLLIISYSHELQLWNLAYKSLQLRIEVPNKTLAFVFSTDGSRFAQIIERPFPAKRGIRIGNYSYIWEFDETTDEFANRDSFKGAVQKMLDAGDILLSREGCLFLRHKSKETKLLDFLTPYHYRYCFSRDAQRLAIAYRDKKEKNVGVTVWHRNGDRFVRSQRLFEGSIQFINLLTFSPSGQQLLMADWGHGYGEKVFIWDL